MKLPFLDRVLDERFFEYRRRSTSVAGIAAAESALLMFIYQYYVNHIARWDLLAIGVAFVIVIKKPVNTVQGFELIRFVCASGFRLPFSRTKRRDESRRCRQDCPARLPAPRARTQNVAPHCGADALICMPAVLAANTPNDL